MFDTYVTVVGTALNTPEWKQVTKTNAIVANFRVASHARRYDRTTEQWVDGPSLRIRVNCWRRLAEGVCASIIAGDPVVVYGRIATREWKNEQGETRLAYELEAVTVGHDLSRGQGRFEKKKLDTITAVIEDADSDARVNGEPTRTIPVHDPSRDQSTEESFDDFDDPTTYGRSDSPETDLDAMAILRGAGIEPRQDGDGDTGDGDTGDATDGEESDDAAAGLGGSGGRGRRRGRQPVPA